MQFNVQLMFNHDLDGFSIYGCTVVADDGAQSTEARVYITPEDIKVCGGPLAAGTKKVYPRDADFLTLPFHNATICKDAVQKAYAEAAAAQPPA